MFDVTWTLYKNKMYIIKYKKYYIIKLDKNTNIISFLSKQYS